MRSFIFLVAFLVTAVTLVRAQTEQMTQTTRDRINFSNLNIPNTGVMYGIKGEDGKVVGNSYLDTTWQAGHIKFYGRLTPTADSLAGVPVRLDLATHDVEIRAGARDIRVAKASTVKYVIVNNQLGSTTRFINVREYRGEADGLPGFFESVVMGKLDLLQYPFIYVKRANYNAAMNTGTKDDELIKKFDWYIAKNKRAVKFSPSKKDLFDLMTDKKDQIEAYLKSEKTDLKSRSGLAAVVAYYNSL